MAERSSVTMASNAEERFRRLGPEDSHTSASSTLTKETNPAANRLQEMIREKRAHTQRAKANRESLPVNPQLNRLTSEQREVQSSPLAAGNRRERPSIGSRRTSGSAGRPVVQKEMGLREMQEVCPFFRFLFPAR